MMMLFMVIDELTVVRSIPEKVEGPITALSDRNIKRKTMRFLFSPFSNFFPNAFLLARRINMQFRAAVF